MNAILFNYKISTKINRILSNLIYSNTINVKSHNYSRFSTSIKYSSPFNYEFVKNKNIYVKIKRNNILNTNQRNIFHQLGYKL